MSHNLIAAYGDLLTYFERYAEHHASCSHWSHKHRRIVDNRTVCDAVGCSCGLVKVLQAVYPNIEWVEPCTDPQPTPTPILPFPSVNKPVIEAAKLINGRYRVRLPEMVDSNTYVEMSADEWKVLKERVLETDEMGIEEL